jgi:hypothetical protein
MKEDTRYVLVVELCNYLSSRIFVSEDSRYCRTEDVVSAGNSSHSDSAGA